MLQAPRPQNSHVRPRFRPSLDSLERRELLTTYTVNSPLDTIDPSDGVLTLREALKVANGSLGVGALSPLEQNQVNTTDPTTTTIGFNIPGTGPHTIAVGTGTGQTRPTPLPTVASSVVIDGYTQPGATPNTLAEGDDANLLIVLDGTSAGSGSHGLTLSGQDTVRGLVIANFSGEGIRADNDGGGNVIQGNFVGTDPTGTLDWGNDFIGIHLQSSSGNLIGGTTPQARNILSGNHYDGVRTDFSSSNVVQGNYIGTDRSGLRRIENGRDGVGIDNGGGNNTIGGAEAGAGNVTSGNNSYGIAIYLGSANVVQGNLVGTDRRGMQAVGNTRGGVFLNATSLNLIGGATPGSRNVVSGNGLYGISFVAASNNRVQGNYIGTAIDGASPLGNQVVGLLIGSSQNAPGTTTGNVIGGTGAGEGNIIAFNGFNQSPLIEAGVEMVRAARNAIRGNRIFGNDGLGIELLNDNLQRSQGVTLNDPGDADVGDFVANDFQNFPVLAEATTTAGSTTVAGTLNSAPNATFALDFFANASLDGTNHGEGEEFLGTAQVTTDAGGNTTFTVPFGVAVPVGRFITATATDLDGNTSEFSAGLALAQGTGNGLDTTGPLLEGAPTTPSANGWYKGDVTVHWTATDAESGVDPATLPADSVITGEGADLSASASVADLAANVTSATVGGIKIDRTAPTTAALVTSGTLPTNGWHRGAVTVGLTSGDALSGVAATYYAIDGGARQAGKSLTLSDDGVHSVVYWSEDVAGNVEAARTEVVRIDSTAPALTFGPTGANPAGWNRADVALAWSASDGGSALAGPSAGTLSFVGQTGIDGATQEVTVSDLAGNIRTFQSPVVRIDRTDPSTSADFSGPIGQGGWRIGPVVVTLTTKEKLSGWARTEYRVDGGNEWTAGTSLRLVANGTHVVEYRSIDAAENVEASHRSEVRIDRTLPVITASAPRVVVSAKAKIIPVSVKGKITDFGSGIASAAVSYSLNASTKPRWSGIKLDRKGSFAITVKIPATSWPKFKTSAKFRIDIRAVDRAGLVSTRSLDVVVSQKRG